MAEKMLLRVRLKEYRHYGDGITDIFIPEGMAGTVLNVAKASRLTVCWDAAFVCDADQSASTDPNKGVIESWEDAEVPMEDVIYLGKEGSCDS
jgi:hypothetical protein